MKLLFTPEALTSYNELKAQQSNEAELAVEVSASLRSKYSTIEIRKTSKYVSQTSF